MQRTSHRFNDTPDFSSGVRTSCSHKPATAKLQAIKRAFAAVNLGDERELRAVLLALYSEAKKRANPRLTRQVLHSASNNALQIAFISHKQQRDEPKPMVVSFGGGKRLTKAENAALPDVEFTITP